MRVLVTGTEGYIGTMLGPVLERRGHHVVGLDTGFYSEGWLDKDRDSRCFSRITEDIRRVQADSLRNFDAIVHMAELSNDPLGQLRPDLTWEINHTGSVNLARRAKEAGVPRFLYTSSCSVYGVGCDDMKTEACATNPQTAYARCKVAVERDVSQMADDVFSPTFLRNATAFGPSPRMRFDIVLNNLSGLAWTTREIRMTSDGSPWRPLVHVLDICEAIACALEAPREAVHNEVFNVGDSNQNYRVREIAEVVSSTFPGCRLTFGRNDGDNRSYRVCFDKIQGRLPGFRCRRDAATGARQLHELFAQLSMPPETFGFRAYTRLKQIQYLISSGKVDDSLFWK